MYPAREHVEFKPQRRWITYILYCQSVLLLLVLYFIKEEEEKIGEGFDKIIYICLNKYNNNNKIKKITSYF